MPKAIDFTSISMRAPPGSREWTRRPGLIARTLSTPRTASRGGSAPRPCFAVERGRGRGIEGLPLLVREAAHRGWGVLAVGEEACSDGLVVSPVAEAVMPSQGPCLSGEAGGVEARGPAVHRVAYLAPSGARAVGCFDGGADMRA
jgi:hypothetical protein